MAAVPGIADIRRVSLRPGDRLVVQLDRPVDDRELDRIGADLQRVFGPDVPVLLIEPGIEITVIGPEEVP